MINGHAPLVLPQRVFEMVLVLLESPGHMAYPRNDLLFANGLGMDDEFNSTRSGGLLFSKTAGRRADFEIQTLQRQDTFAALDLGLSSSSSSSSPILLKFFEPA
ncbi:hypothetical protein MCOR25_009615 [Pyricularia grisea]|uniref:Uncharacterized protein n=1 Tax=Pyricularia grisea TaxID=148305 RepID=A0A6P8BDE8_PYRGI|nr:uncharacterized protein PgNI_03368 [Pyricularia grisea]KAI6352012.1 hypothetical protein MCOR25_009615 [Pyricularia grisea]TLD13692.1 hypothetical protein PgNI_03368 [Pyricularia grisea]